MSWKDFEKTVENAHDLLVKPNGYLTDLGIFVFILIATCIIGLIIVAIFNFKESYK